MQEQQPPKEEDGKQDRLAALSHIAQEIADEAPHVILDSPSLAEKTMKMTGFLLRRGDDAPLDQQPTRALSIVREGENS